MSRAPVRAAASATASSAAAAAQAVTGAAPPVPASSASASLPALPVSVTPIAPPQPYTLQIEDYCKLNFESNTDLAKLVASVNCPGCPTINDVLKFNFSKCGDHTNAYNAKNTINAIYRYYVKSMMNNVKRTTPGTVAADALYRDKVCFTNYDDQAGTITKESLLDCQKRWDNHYTETLARIRADSSLHNAAIDAMVMDADKGKKQKVIVHQNTEDQGQNRPTIVNDIFQLSKVQGPAAVPKYVLGGAQPVTFNNKNGSNADDIGKLKQKKIIRKKANVDEATAARLSLESGLEVASAEEDEEIEKQLNDKVRKPSAKFARELKKQKEKEKEAVESEEKMVQRGLSAPSFQGTQRETLSEIMEQAHNEQLKKDQAAGNGGQGLETPGQKSLNIELSLTPKPRDPASNNPQVKSIKSVDEELKELLQQAP